MRTRTWRVEIEERPHHWDIRGDVCGQTKTAAEALKRVMDLSRDCSSVESISVVAVITWTFHSKVGGQIVSALQVGRPKS